MNCTVCRQTIHQIILRTTVPYSVDTVTFHSGQDSSKTFFTRCFTTNCGLLEFKSPSSQGSTVNKAGLGVNDCPPN